MAPATPEASAAGAPRRVGVIGCGRIAAPVAQALQAGEIPGFALGGVLARRRRTVGPLQVGDDADAFLQAGFDLIVEAAGPAALATHGERALLAADVWTVNGTALADPALQARLTAACRRGRHRLRLVPGAIAGLDGVAMAATDPDASLRVTVELPPSAGEAREGFRGSAREAAVAYPDGVNVAVAAALAGPGLDRTVVEVRHDGARHRLAVAATSRHGQVQASLEPAPGLRWHPVAASLIACLRREALAIWVG